MQSENGLFWIPVPKHLAQGMNHTEFIWTHQMLGYIEQGMIKQSGRIVQGLLNGLLHRNDDISAIKLRTMTDMVERNGTAFLRQLEIEADEILLSHGWDPTTGKPTENAELLPGLSAFDTASYGLEDDPLVDLERQYTINWAIDQVNKTRDPVFQIPEGSEKPFLIEPNPAKTVAICLDGVQAKRQKDERPKEKAQEPIYTQDSLDGPAAYARGNEPKKRPKVETVTAHVSYEGMKYVLMAENMFQLCKLVLAFLLSHELLVGRQLLVFSDGGRDIKYAIENIFDFCPHTIVLDWFHLKKHVNELMSLSFYGGKKNKEFRSQISRTVFEFLWVGNTEAAQQYLQSLAADQNKPIIKDREWFDELVDYLGRKDYAIACYAVRKRLSLPWSSNPVEKVNDLVVATRQKHQGMSWSRTGSWGLAAITIMYMNHENESWHHKRKIGYGMYEKYGQVYAVDDTDQEAA